MARLSHLQVKENVYSGNLLQAERKGLGMGDDLEIVDMQSPPNAEWFHLHMVVTKALRDDKELSARFEREVIDAAEAIKKRYEQAIRAKETHDCTPEG